MTPFEAYQLFNSLRLHFTTDYDFIKYQGKSTANFDAFNRRRDKFHYAKLAKQRDPQGFIVANFVSGSPPKWIGDLNTEEAGERYTEYLARTQSFTYRFDLEVRGLPQPLVSNFKVKDGQHPNLLVLFRQNSVSIETLVVLDHYIKFFPMWDSKIDDTILWPSIRHKCLKYKPFMRYDSVKIKTIISEVLAESMDI